MFLVQCPLKPAHAIATPYYCDQWGGQQKFVGDALCKYAMAKGGYVANSLGNYVIEVAYARGGTASQSCDRTNDVVQWAVDQSEGKGDLTSAFLYDRNSGSVFWTRGRTSYRDNCSVDSSSALWIFDINKVMHRSRQPAISLTYWHKKNSTASTAPGFATLIVVPIPPLP
jgi:hypothetical protein